MKWSEEYLLEKEQKAPLGVNKEAAEKMKTIYRWPEDERPIIFLWISL